jgi:endonuclease-3
MTTTWKVTTTTVDSAPESWDGVLHRIADAVGSEFQAGVNQIAPDAGSEEAPFRVLVSTLISLRTRDEVTIPASQRLLAAAPDAQRLAQLSEERIQKLIYPAGFYKTKARNLKQIGRILFETSGGSVPRTREALTDLPGVGPKTANLVLGLGFGIDAICVDTHVHRIPNRLGWIATSTPEESETALMEILPRRYWIPINQLLVGFGQLICTPVSPRCTACPLSETCPRVGVARHR